MIKITLKKIPGSQQKWGKCLHSDIQGGGPCIVVVVLAVPALPWACVLSVPGDWTASERPCRPLASGHTSKLRVDINSIQQIRFPERLPENFTSAFLPA